MTQPNDRRIHADALRRQHRSNQWYRFQRQAGAMLASIVLGAMAAPYVMLAPQTLAATTSFYQATATAWIADGTVANPTIRIKGQGEVYAHAVIADPYYRGAARATIAYATRGSFLGFAG